MAEPSGAALSERLRACLPAPADDSSRFADEIAAIASALLERFDPWQIVLYGSRAYGTPTEESDVDLMVVMNTRRGMGEQAGIIRAAPPSPHGLALSIQVRTPDQIALGLAEGDFFVRDVMRKGITLLEQAGASQRIELMAAEKRREMKQGELKHATRGWLDRADKGLVAAERLMDMHGAEDTICFYGQEVSTAALRALLQEQNVEFCREDDVAALARLARPWISDLASMQRDLEWVSRFTLDVCYPNPPVTDFDPGRAVRLAKEVRECVRKALGLVPETGMRNI